MMVLAACLLLAGLVACSAAQRTGRPCAGRLRGCGLGLVAASLLVAVVAARWQGVMVVTGLLPLLAGAILLRRAAWRSGSRGPATR